MSDYALVNNQTNKVENVIHWDGVSPWEPPEGHTLVNMVGQAVGIGYTYTNGEFIAPPLPPKPQQETTVSELQAQLATLQQQIASLAPKT